MLLGMTTCITIYYIVSHDKIYPKELQLLQPLVHLYLSLQEKIRKTQNIVFSKYLLRHNVVRVLCRSVF